MASLRLFPRGFVCSSGKKLAIFEYSENNGVTKKEITLQGAETGSVADDKSDKEDDVTPKPKVSSKMEEQYILASKISPSGRYLAVCDNVKQLHVIDAAANWGEPSRRELARRCTAVTFSHDDLHVLVADKTGDVYRYSVGDMTAGEGNKGGQLLLGHLSMLLDVILTSDDQYLVTCDRDEKIRISHYPNCYNIHTFCLGHKGYVTSLICVEDRSLLISGGGEGEIMVWTLNGEKCAEAICVRGSDNQEGSSHDHGDFGVKRLAYDPETCVLSAICYGCKQVYIFKLEYSECGVSLTDSVTMATDTEPWDICFDEDHNLWVLQPHEEQTVTVYRWNKDTARMQRLQTDDTKGRVCAIMAAINDSWDFFRESVGASIHLPEGLRKVKVDNMKDYLEKKQERISGIKRKTDQSESQDIDDTSPKNS